MILTFNETGRAVLLEALSNYRLAISSEIENAKNLSLTKRLLLETEKHVDGLISDIEKAEMKEKYRVKTTEIGGIVADEMV